jgi:hypothetical protein
MCDQKLILVTEKRRNLKKINSTFSASLSSCWNLVVLFLN